LSYNPRDIYRMIDCSRDPLITTSDGATVAPIRA
jgi:hypothetical protein